MKVNNIENVSKVIYLLDKHIMKILSKNNVDEDKLASLTEIRTEYVESLNNLIRTRNTRDMYDKEYWKSYRQTKL